MIFVGQKSRFWKNDVPRKRGQNLSMLKDGCYMFHSGMGCILIVLYSL